MLCKFGSILKVLMEFFSKGLLVLGVEFNVCMVKDVMGFFLF